MKKNLVIVGVGFAGINTYTSLPYHVKKQCNITVIDKHNYFLFTPLLHEVATGSLDVHHIVEPIENIVGPEVTVVQDTVTAFDHDTQMIQLENSEDIPYDILVLALGSQSNFFGTKGAQEKSFTLKDLHDAQVLRNHFITRFQEASMISSSEERAKHLSTVIVGGGPTGVELAGETAELFFHTFKKQYEGSFDVSEASITLLNASPSLLQPFSPGSQYYSQRILREKGVTVQNNVTVTEVTDEGIVTDQGETIPTSTTIWTAGVLPQDIDCSSFVEKDHCRILVEKTLQLSGHSNVFVLGDMAMVKTKSKKGYPLLAQVAVQQGKLTAKNIKRLLNNEPLSEFEYTEMGKLASLGQWHAIAEIGPLHLRGAFAWFMWRTIYLVNFVSWNKRLRIMIDWTFNLFSPRDTTQID